LIIKIDSGDKCPSANKKKVHNRTISSRM